MRPYRPRNPAINAELMSRVRHRDNAAEVALRQALWRQGLRYRLQSRQLPGRPDIVFPGACVVVFVDGDFWHGRVLLESGHEALAASFRGPRPEWWVAKIERTVARDRDVTRTLEEAGWHVLRFWERDLKRDLKPAVARIVAQVRERQGGCGCTT